MKITAKEGVRLKGLTPALVELLSALIDVTHQVSTVDEVVITSINDGRHSPTSRHYTNEALDLRTKNFPSEGAKLEFARALRARLGPAFTVLYEDPGGPNQHLHLQPKKGTVYAGPANPSRET